MIGCETHLFNHNQRRERRTRCQEVSDTNRVSNLATVPFFFQIQIQIQIKSNQVAIFNQSQRICLIRTLKSRPFDYVDKSNCNSKGSRDDYLATARSQKQ